MLPTSTVKEPEGTFTAVSRKVVGKSASDNPERYCGWFCLPCSPKKIERMARKAKGICSRVLMESNKSRFDSYSRQEQCIDHIPLLVFSVTPFKVDQNQNQNRSIDKVQNLGNERRYVYKDPRQDSGQRNISHTRYPKKCFTQTYRDLYGDSVLVLTWMSSNMANGNQQKHHSVTEFFYKSVNLFFEKLINIKVILFLIHELFR